MAAVNDLDKEWQTPEKQQLYTKPSNKLLNMRVMLKGMLKARRFQDVDVIGQLIVEQEKQESSAAAEQMQHDFQIADERLTDLSETERIGIMGRAEVKMSRIIRDREMDLRPLIQKMDNLKRIRDVEISNQKKVSYLEPVAASQNTTATLSGTRIPAFVHTPRLIVQPFAPKRRPGSCILPSQRKVIYRPKAVLLPVSTQ